MKLLYTLFFMTNISYAMTVEQELLDYMLKTNTVKEITSSTVLCKEYTKLYNSLNPSLKINYEKFDCRTEASDDAEKNTANLLESVQNHENYIKNNNKKIDDYQLNLIVESLNPYKDL